MSELKGYMGKILEVKLSEREISEMELDKNLAEDYIGGNGFGVKILWDELESEVDPLSPDNIFIVSTGPFTTRKVPGSGSIFYQFKSPATNGWGETRSGGDFGYTLKKAGFDALIIRGAADEPVYLSILNGEAEIKDAKDIWGRSVREATERLEEDFDHPDSSVACIGPAGENMVRYAAIMNDIGRAAGRCGGGAVMGSKNLKAIVVAGDSEEEIADPEKFEDTLNKVRTGLQDYTFEAFKNLGTSSLVEMLSEPGALPTRNFKTGFFEDFEEIGGEKLNEEYVTHSTACHDCMLGCGRYSEVTEGKYKSKGEGPEYETLDMLGANLGINNIEAIIKAGHKCNDMGLDTISTGGSIAFAIEAFQKGLLTTDDTDGLELDWGDADLMLDLIDRISKREGFGDFLAEGVKRMSDELGGDSKNFAMHVKGLEVPAHEPRAETKNMAIQYAITPRGACHMHPNWAGAWDFVPLDNGLADYDLPENPDNPLEELGINRGDAYRLLALHGELGAALGLCRFYLWGAEEQENLHTPKFMSSLFTALTGIEKAPEKLLTDAERIWNLKRCFNIREGKGREDDILPDRMMEPIESGPSEGKSVEDLKGLIDEAYDAFEWDKETGVPKKEKLEELSLGEITTEL